MSVRRRSTDLIIMRIVQEQAKDLELGVLIRQDPGRLVCLVVGTEQLVELSARTVAVVGARRHVETGNPLNDLAERIRPRVRNLEAHSGHFNEIRATFAVLLRHRTVRRNLAESSNPDLDADDRRLLRLHQFDGVRISREPAFRRADLLEKPAPSKLKPDLVIRGEMRILADPGRDVVFLLKRFEMRIIKGKIGTRKLIAEAHARKHEHPATGNRVVGVDVERMVFHQPAEVRRPGPRTGELSGRVAYRQINLECLGRQDESVIVLIPRPEPILLDTGLLDFPRRQARHPLSITHLASSSVMTLMRLKSIRG